MSISGIEAMGFTPYVAPVVTPTAVPTVAGPQGPDGTGAEFGELLLDGIERLESVQTNADQLAVKAATGDLDSMHDYTIAATEASVTTQLTVAVRNRAVEAFNEIMRMQV
ncbi:flagellar hook-basal body complex protein FliE [Nocardioides daphniae]|uniref:Flagellar hook-basal body complex protein FliE n=1 Tax=Nocardioides daphniae TaxID=402297 RepID=A0A4P7UHP6_9ACTN|nr:flagellar hook-basal body complex protein FliE [Nocardioides daphniae]QCC78159.1 flagellar hook-basal body complex protein FliE [Nocardioides daphniae]